ncbi:uncharacterized protein LOC135955283 isoform X2 [Calliphora vicina]|uniref:uncharacterized protein LOC135955283 isoform X2 n=1 Tax=Calliphora vicina TaxID=7373 RepID=UPI00325A974C
MKFFIVLCALVAAATADVSHLTNKYLPPTHQHAASAPAVSYSAPAPSYHVEAASAPAVSYSAPATQSYHVEAASAPAVSYSAPATQSYHVEAASAPAVSYSAPATQSYHVEAASAPAVSYSAPAASYETASYETAAAEPAHTFSSAEGYRYKTNKRRVIRRRREVSTEYLPPVAASAPVAQFESYEAPAASYETASYDVAASEPAHSFSSADGYRYRTSKRRVIRRRRRDVSSEYLPPVAASAPVAQYESYEAPAASYETASYDVAASEPAHSFSSDEGYRYRTAKRRVIRRRRRDVSHLSSEYLPPHQGAGSSVSSEYLPPVAASSQDVSYSAPAASYETASYDVAASEPAHSFSSAEGYRYKTNKRRVIRRRRDVSHLSSEYLPPVAASAPVAQYESYEAPAASYETASYDVAASEPAHSFSSAEGYRYKTSKRRVIRRRRRDVSHLSSEYLPPHQGASSSISSEYLPPVAASTPVAHFESAPSYSVAASAPAVSYSTPAASYETASYETSASAPAHSFSSAEGYRYKTAKRRVIRRRF